ncbi:MAG: hypothetical protein ACXACD_19085 [Candidatus Thorarchaeota archaeon]|jgi:hypothetical protein
MATQVDSVLAPLNEVEGLSDASTEMATQIDLSSLFTWASDATGILNTTSPEELRRNGIKTIVDEYLQVPSPRSLVEEVSKITMEAQGKLLRFSHALKMYFEGGTDEQELEDSKQSFLSSLSTVMQVTS